MDVECEILIQFMQTATVYALFRRILPRTILNETIKMETLVVQSLCVALASLVSAEITKLRKRKESS